MGVSIQEAPMFARVKKSGKYHYLQLVENNKVKGQVKQRVIATVGLLDQQESLCLVGRPRTSSLPCNAFISTRPPTDMINVLRGAYIDVSYENWTIKDLRY
jgi:hypothetical protein